MECNFPFHFNGSAYKPLKHSECTEEISAFIKKNKPHGFNLDKIMLPKKNTLFSNNLHILIIKLRVFRNLIQVNKIKNQYDLGEILLGTVEKGFNFNSFHKKRVEVLTRSYLKGEVNLVYTEFPASHLLPWLDEEPIDNIYVFGEPKEVNQRLNRLVTSVMHRNIQDYALIRDIDLIDALYLVDNKKTLHTDKKGHTIPSHEARGTDMDISFPKNNILDFDFKKVTTDPCTSRCAGLSSVQGRNLIYSAHSNLDLVTNSSYDLYKDGLEPSSWINRLSAEEDTYFIMIDFKKSGLTTNREVIKTVYKTALNHYPGFRPWAKYLECLENVRVNGTYSKRGTSLGMDDNAISFYLSCAFEAWMESNEYYRSYIKFANFKGDDQIICVKGKLEIVQKIFRRWIKRLSHLGFLVNAKKSFIGIRGQFCEIVGRGDGIHTKEIEFALNAFDALGAYNIIDFKIRINLLMRALNHYTKYSKIFEYAIATAIRLVEPEFLPTEIYAPFEMGGYTSYYYKSINTFLIEASKGKFDYLDRRFFNVIGFESPEPSFSYKKVKNFIAGHFKDLDQLHQKLRAISAKPMSAAWKKCYDECLEKRRTAFYGRIQLKGSRYQTLIDRKEKYIPPEEMITIDNSEYTAIYKAKYKAKFNVKDFVKKPTRKIENKTDDKKFYLIDKVRARLLLEQPEKGNPYGIKYYIPMPISTILWSLMKPVTRSKYSIPIKWVDFIVNSNISSNDLWDFYYNELGLNLYHIRLRWTSDEESILPMFRGPDNSDSVIICPVSGFPRKFNSSDLDIFLSEKRRKLQFYFKFSIPNFFPNWTSEEMLIAFYGYNMRNESIDISHLTEYVPYDPVYQERIEHFPGSEYCPEGVDPEVFFWYHESYGTLEEPDEGRKSEEFNSFDITVPGETHVESSDESYEAAHDSDSDEIKNFLKGEFLNEGSEDEENPIDISSRDSEEESSDSDQ